ncbi:DUF6879 family protein [Saccharothrix syringae]|uniref:DUF6879 domain-containing protein n=1 Tax=Saccharothrix syringae TaxID=103733 RepID=A0A5Q0GU10_SACSY|nr:DUF6879 family protein [Saccharothrix syringae]QFZ16964.1 hypothetical protein EKG83_05325 [Saccharothrix syringae]
MSELTTVFPGTELAPDEYLADFNREFWHDNSGVSWKLERRQEFIESNNASWEASRRNDWTTSLDLLEKRRAKLADYERRIADNGMEVRRVRVVEQPISPYLLWELSSLHVRHQVGGKIRVVGPEQVEPFERGRTTLPELFLLARPIAYQVLYDEQGALAGAVKCVITDEVEHWKALVADLYDRGEELGAFFHREVARQLPSTG